MRKISFYISLLSVLLITTSATEDNCDVRALKNELIRELRPDFKYDSSNINRFILENKEQGTEVQVPIFSSESYRLLFNTVSLPTNFEINIYNKKVGSSNRKLLFSVKGSETDKHVFVFEPENAKTMYIDYLLPATTEKGLTGCVVFLMGYKIG
jgi:hypothetical protein